MAEHWLPMLAGALGVTLIHILIWFLVLCRQEHQETSTKRKG